MSLLEELESRGVTAEDLEKAASVRLFEKAAAAEDVDLESLDQETVEQLYSTFISNNQSYDYETTKEANAMNDEIVNLFEKQAAAEGIDLDSMDDTDLANLYNHYVEDVLPAQIGEDTEVEEAHAKLAEAEILGRHMARSYMDEMDKEAGPWGEAAKAEGAAARDSVKRGYESAKARAGKVPQQARDLGAKARERASAAGASAASGARAYGRALRGDEVRSAMKGLKASKAKGFGRGVKGGRAAAQHTLRRAALRGGAKTTAAYGGLAAAGAGAKKLYDKHASDVELDAYVDELANERLGEFLFEEGFELDY